MRRLSIAAPEANPCECLGLKAERVSRTGAGGWRARRSALERTSIASDRQSRGIGRSHRMLLPRWGQRHVPRVARQMCNRPHPGGDRRAPPELVRSTSETTTRKGIAGGDAGYPHLLPNRAGWRKRTPDRCVNLRRLPAHVVRDARQWHERQSKILEDGSHRSPPKTHASRRTKLRGLWSSKAGERLHRLPLNRRRHERNAHSAHRPAYQSVAHRVRAAIALQRNSARSPSSPEPCEAHTASDLLVEHIS